MPEPKNAAINDLHVCPVCGASILLHVNVTAKPLCNNPAIHSKRTIEMIKSQKDIPREN
jgi:hypothetical protein